MKVMLNMDSLLTILVSIFLTSASVLLNFFEFIGRTDKAVMEPVLHIVQLMAAVCTVTMVLNTLSPRFNKWLSRWL